MATTLSVAFEAVGVKRCYTEFEVALAKLRNNGGEYDVALTMLKRAYGRGGDGPVRSASDGPEAVAVAPNGEAGQAHRADKAIWAVPASPINPAISHPFDPPTSREFARNWSDRKDASPPGDRPRPDPGHAKRGMAVIAAIDEDVKRSLFDLIRLPDGRSLSQVMWCDAVPLAIRYTKNAHMLLAAHRFAIPPDPKTPLGQCVPPVEQERIVSKLEGANAVG